MFSHTHNKSDTIGQGTTPIGNPANIDSIVVYLLEQRVKANRNNQPLLGFLDLMLMEFKDLKTEYTEETIITMFHRCLRSAINNLKDWKLNLVDL